MEPESINDYILSISQDEVLKYKTVDCDLYTRSDEYNLSLHKSTLEEKSNKFLCGTALVANVDVYFEKTRNKDIIKRTIDNTFIKGLE